MGELLPGKTSNFDDHIMPFISSCNIACGFHSGTPGSIENTASKALSHNVKIGAHPSYNDKENFGRKSINVNHKILLPEIRYQISAVKGIVESLGGRLHHVKPHGALYNDMVKDNRLAQAIVKIIKEIDSNLIVFGLAHSNVAGICKELNVRFVNEGFADRRYENLTELRSRNLEGAVIYDIQDVLSQIDNFTNGKVALYQGETKIIKVESICLHSDTQGAVQLSQKIYNFLKEKNVAISAN